MTSSTRTDTARMPSGMMGGSPAPASFEASLAGEHRLVLDDRRDDAAADQLLGVREAAFRRLALGKLHDLEVVGLELGAELEIGRRRRRPAAVLHGRLLAAGCSPGCRFRTPDRLRRGWQWRGRQRFGCAYEGFLSTPRVAVGSRFTSVHSTSSHSLNAARCEPTATAGLVGFKRRRRYPMSAASALDRDGRSYPPRDAGTSGIAAGVPVQRCCPSGRRGESSPRAAPRRPARRRQAR